VESLAFPHGVVFLQKGHFVKWNNAEFTNVSSFTLLLVQHTIYDDLQDTSFFPPHQQQFFSVSVFWNPQRVSLAGPVFKPPGCCSLLGQLKVITT
jgi:hypothetical protein